MKLHALDIPDDASQVPTWLARKVIGLELAELISELMAAHGRTPGPLPSSDAPDRLVALLDNRRGEVLKSGLGVLTSQEIGRLLAEPELLAALQELVLTEGGIYWQQLAQQDSQFEPLLTGANAKSGDKLRPSSANEPATSFTRRPWYTRPLAVALATAASTLFAAYGIDYFKPAEPAVVSGWNWARAGSLPQNVSASQYLNRLADSAEQGIQKPAEDAPALARRISEFRQGCSQLLLAQHEPLSDADREWLIDRCRNVWAPKFEDYLHDVENHRKLELVQADMKAAVQQLAKELRERARSA